MRLATIIMEVLLGDREAIRAAAIRFPDGKVIEGTFHADCWLIAYDQGYVAEQMGDEFTAEFLIQKYKAEEGFTTTQGRFVDREEAYRIAIAAQQRPPEHGTDFHSLDSHDVADEYL